MMTYPNKLRSKIQVHCEKHNAYTSSMLCPCSCVVQIDKGATKSNTEGINCPIALRHMHMNNFVENFEF